MADDRIDIEINDQIDPSISKKLRDIASGADKGETSVKKLKAALASINNTPSKRLKDATDSVTNSLNRELAAQNRLSAATAKSTVADARAAVEKQRLATETARTEAAQNRAAAAAARAASAQLSLQAAQARLSGTANAAGAAEQKLGSEVEQARQRFAAGEINIRRYVQALEAARSSSAAGGIGGAPSMGGLGNVDTPVNNGKKLQDAQDGVTKSSKAMGHQTANIMAQFNDLGVQFSMAAASSKPLQGVMMALIQQGSQLSYIASTMEGGWSGIAKTFGTLALKLAPLIILFGAAYAAVKSFTDETNKNSGLDEYVKTLGLTSKELKKLEGQHVTITDTIKGHWQTLSENLLSNMGLSTEEIASLWDTVSTKILHYMKLAYLGIGAGIIATVKFIGAIVGNIGKMFYNAGMAAKNLFLVGIEILVNKTVDGINAIGGAINYLSEKAGLGKVVGELNKWKSGVGGVKDGMMQITKLDFAGDFAKSMENGRESLARTRRNSIKNAQDRLKQGADALKGDRGDGSNSGAGKVDKTAENRAHALKMVNLELDNELKRMQMLKPEREIAQKMDQIEQQLASKKIILSQTERAEIEKKIKAVSDYAFVQAESDRIYEEAIGPVRDMNAAISAATALYDAGKISLESYNAELYKATENHAKATNPLYEMNKAYEQANALIGLYGIELEKAIYLQQLDQAYRAKGLSMYDASTGKLKAEVAELIAKNNALRQQQYIQSQVTAVAQPFLEENMMIANKQAMYDQIERMRQTDLANEGAWHRAKLALDAKFSEMRLSGASSFFGELAGLASSGNKKLAAIGKAAAVAQATIDGFVAVQKALASAPPPWNIALAAAVAVKTGVQVAGIMSTNVGSFATGGQFMVDGKAGVDRNNINMNVSRGERVTIETPAQQRAAQQGSNAPVTQVTKVQNFFDEREFIGAMDSEEGEEVIMNIIRRRKSDVNQITGNAK